MSGMKQGMLVLEDGSAFPGVSLGAEGEWVGEVVFNTSMTGYQEIITDPSYWGQMVVFTCPHIGNVGVNNDDVESRQPYVRAVLARQICEQPSNWRARRPLPEYLAENGVPALSGLDTRRLTLILRDRGVMRGALSTENLDQERLRLMAGHAADMSALTPVGEVSRRAQSLWSEVAIHAWIAHAPAGDGNHELPHVAAPHEAAPHVAVLDCGTKHNILRLLAGMGARVTVFPWDADPAGILAARPDGVVVSNGPGDPRQVMTAVEHLRELMTRLPVYGICLGHQLIALAGGARIYKLPFGHHGGNHPVQELATGRIEITAQNHNYAVEPDSLKGLPYDVTRVNLYDGTIEGLRHRDLPVECVQYHPEASPGPHDSLHLIRGFVNSLPAKG